MNKICEICSKEYWAEKKKRRFCSRYCGVRGRGGPNKRTELLVNCPICQKQFRHKPSKKRKYCSVKCYGLAEEETQKGELNHNYSNAGQKSCNLCSKKYKAYDKNRKYCSIECAGLSLNTVKHMAHGYNAERELKIALEKAGYFVVRSAGSRGPADLVAINDEETALIQLKHTSMKTVSLFSKLKKDVIDLIELRETNDKVKKYIWVRFTGRSWFSIDMTAWTDEDWEKNLKKWIKFIKDHPMLALEESALKEIMNYID